MVFKLATWQRLLAVAVLGLPPMAVHAADEARFESEIKPILSKYCFDCHADGMDKGSVTFDTHPSTRALLDDRKLWLGVLKNVRAGLMPPAKKKQPSDEEKSVLESWIKREAFSIDPQDPDPGRVTLRRLNRVEYQNTIKDLMDVDYNTTEEFPPDDTGYGFDTVGDALMMSPLLIEKYMQAAETIVQRGVPRVPRVVKERQIGASEFREPGGKATPERLSFYKEGKFEKAFKVHEAGEYRVRFLFDVNGSFDFDPGRCQVVVRLDGREVLNQEFGWRDHQRFELEFTETWEPGEKTFAMEVKPLEDESKKKNFVELRLISVRMEGPTDPAFWTKTRNYDRFFHLDEPPAEENARSAYLREVLRRFATKAFRRPVDEPTLGRLADIAEDAASLPGARLEDGVAQAMVAVLASPRFLYRIEEAERADSQSPNAPVDEFALASRLSYFFWSSMPDQELFDLALKGELRANLAGQVERMVKSQRSEAFVRNFAGQWLQARDVEGISINARAVMRREGQRVDYDLEGDLRNAMRRETEMYFSHAMREDRPLPELLDSDYTFLNERLASHYGIHGVSGREFRKVTLPANSPRGGLITQGTVLVVTSNPTRTSPVKRGLFILDNILGTPAPPPPPGTPPLEEAEKQTDHEPTMREAMEIHRKNPLCSSCHTRMDPLGLALENFNALGMWREKERGQPVDPTGQLITGETFQDIRELKKILATSRRDDFYRCLAEKMLTYALGRGPEYYDVEAIDQIVARIHRDEGRFSALLMGVVESAPFQKRRIEVKAAGPAQAAFQP